MAVFVQVHFLVMHAICDKLLHLTLRFAGPGVVADISVVS